MPNKSPTIVRKTAPEATDPRVQRSVHALGVALVELMQEREFGSITVQQILDRAGVGRATFYSHYRNKHDVLYSSYERLFAMLERALDASPTRATRIAPATEFIQHIGDSAGVADALRASGQLEAMWSFATDCFARMIERRIEPAPGVPVSLTARMLAGAFLEMVKWWHEHPGAATPAQVDAAFHDMARRVLQPARGTR